MKIEQYLQRAGKSITSERMLLAKWMKSQHLFTANDIQKNFSTVSRASVFRTLKLFVEIGYLRALNLSNTGELSYEVECCAKHHHEHMRCENCGSIFSFDSQNICNQIFVEAKRLGFEVSQHSLSVSGICTTCHP